MTKLSIIILAYNSSKDIEGCIESIFSYYSKEIESGEFELVVTDNASADNTVDIVSDLKKRHKKIHFFKNEENFGFAKGLNLASKNANGEFLLYLNPDTKVINSNISSMIELANSDKKIGVIGGQIVSSNGKKELSAGRFYNLKNLFFLVMGLENFFKVRFSPKNSQSVDFVSGGFMMVKKDLFFHLKGFDDNFFMYVEDIEFCYRVKKNGYKVMFCPFAKIIHEQHGSSNRSFAIINIYKGMLYFYKKHKSKYEYFIAKILLEAKATAAIFIGIINHNSGLKQTYKRALKF